MKSSVCRTKLKNRTEMSRKLNEIIEEALKGFFKLVSRTSTFVGTNTYDVGDSKGFLKAKRFLEKWGIESENLRGFGMTASHLESLRLKMNGKVCVDAPDWFRRCDPEEIPPTILYVPEKLALKILALGYLPEPEEEASA